METTLKINIYTALPEILERVKGVALTATVGKTSAWMQSKLSHNVTARGKEKVFISPDVEELNIALVRLADELSEKRITFGPVRDEVIAQVKDISQIVCMPYVCDKVLKKPRSWYYSRVKPTGKKNSSFSEDDVFQINLAVMNIANFLKSIELTL